VLVGLALALEMCLVLGGDYFYAPDASLPATPAAASNTRELGALLVGEYVYPFELTAALLLMAIVAAVAITFRGAQKTRNNSPEAQIKVKAAERVRLVKMPTETAVEERAAAMDNADSAQ
jgi:NADH-quinone oxidoreductase subunit J